jgi:hypothetical protein
MFSVPWFEPPTFNVHIDVWRGDYRPDWCQRSISVRFIRDAGQDLSMSKWASEAIVAIANIAAESRTDLK